MHDLFSVPTAHMTRLSPEDITFMRDLFRAMREEGWRTGGEPGDRGFGIWEWRKGDLRVEFRNHGTYGSLFLGGGGIELTTRVGRLQYAVNLLVASGWAPVRFSSHFEDGLSSGRWWIAENIRRSADGGDAYRSACNDRQLDDALADARTYWLSVLAQRAVELERPLEALLDRKPYPRQRQRESVVDAVREVLERD